MKPIDISFEIFKENYKRVDDYVQEADGMKKRYGIMNIKTKVARYFDTEKELYDYIIEECI